MRELRVIRTGLVPYGIANEWQENLHLRRVANESPDILLLLEHPHVYSLGKRFKSEHLLLREDLLRSRGVEVVESDRGGSITYHGPGQLVGYPILDLRREENPKDHPDPIKYLKILEQTLILTLRQLGIVARRREGLTGVWVGNEKIASIGVRISRGVSKHGFALNVATDLSYFENMIPCGIPDVAMTSIEKVLKSYVRVNSVEGYVAKNLATLLHRRVVEGTVEDAGLLESGNEETAKMRGEADVIPFPKTSSG